MHTPVQRNDTISSDLLEKYRNTEFIVYNKFTLVVDEVSEPARELLEIHKAESGIFITAHNINGEILKDLDNTILNKELKELLNYYDLFYYDGVGKLGDWKEDSFFIMNPSDTQKQIILKQCRQNAYLYVDKLGKVFMIEGY